MGVLALIAVLRHILPTSRGLRVWELAIRLAAAVLVVVLYTGRRAEAQGVRLQQSQADAAQRMILLAVEQGIAALPPASGQSFNYVYDPQRDTFIRSRQPGPIVLRSPETLGKGVADVRVAASYFHLDESFSPIGYELDVFGGGAPQFTRFGLDASADVTLLTFGFGYGVTDWLEVTLTLPVVLVQARARAVFLVPLADANTKPSQAQLAFVDNAAQLSPSICRSRNDPGCTIVVRDASFPALGLESFSSGTNAGLGRSAVGAKVELAKYKGFQLSFAPDVLLPSPNQAQLAGSDTFAIGPRLIGAFVYGSWLRWYTDIGYDYDFDVAELRRFAWNSGVSIPFSWVAFDLGVGGSQYQRAIEWTPDSAPVPDPGNPHITVARFAKLPGEDNELGTTFVDLLVGAKLKVASHWLVDAAVVVPLDQSPFQPDALATLAVELVF